MTAFFHKTWVRRTVYAATVLAILTAVSVLGLIVVSCVQNQTIRVTPYTVTHKDIPAAFDGKRIVQLSDLHNCDFGDRLTTLVKEQSPDIIVITGDWIGENDTDITVAKRQAAALCGIAPIYYVAGNHESQSAFNTELFVYLEELGFIVLDSEAAEWRIGDEAIQLIGMYDPEFSTHLYRDAAPYVKTDMYSVLLFHRPEYFKTAVSLDFDLILSGHAHGGQIRLPLIGALYAPNQGWFPEYDVGRYTEGDTTMIVNQGLGVSVLMRVLAPPEITVITLDSPYV